MPPSADSSTRESQAQSRRADFAITEGIEADIEACHQLSAFRRIREAAFFAGLYITGAALVGLFAGQKLLVWLGIILMGIALNSLGILIHEGLHGLLAKNAKWNHFFGVLCGLPLLISFSAYRATHSDHHFDFGRKLDYGTYRQHLQNKFFVWTAYYSQLFFGSILYILVIPILAWRSSTGKVRRWIAVEYACIISMLFMLTQFVIFESFLTFWLYPSLILMLLTNIRGLASHALGDLDDIYLSSRTVKASPVIEWIFLHENYHLEHHLFPQVPSYNLKRIHNLVWNRLPKALYAQSYFSFLASFILASLKGDLQPAGRVNPASNNTRPQ